MTTIMESSTLESVNDESSHLYVPVFHKTIINLNYFLDKSFKEYNYHLVDNDLKLKRHDKNKLGIHFILKQIPITKIFAYLEKKLEKNAKNGKKTQKNAKNTNISKTGYDVFNWN